MKTELTHLFIRVAALAIILPGFLTSCFREGVEDCGLYLEFVYDYNMEFVDSFDPQVPSVDVLVFDDEGKYMFTKHAERSELGGSKRMYLSEGLTFGKQYTIITVGGLSDRFTFSGTDGRLVPGITPLENDRLALKRTTAEVSHEFPGLWFGPAMQIEYKSNNRVWPVKLVKETNLFLISLIREDEKEAAINDGEVRYTFEIVTQDGAVYDIDNNPLLSETVTYKPYLLEAQTNPETVTLAKINTLWLLRNDDYPYRFIIREADGGKKVWEFDLIKLLSYSKPDFRPDGSELPMQEYLDRQSEWNITLLYREGEKPGGGYGFVAVGLVVTDWIV